MSTETIQVEVVAEITITVTDDAPEDLFTRGEGPDWADVPMGAVTIAIGLDELEVLP